MNKITLAAAALTFGLAVPVAADPTIGVGLSLSFARGQVDTGVGVRLFSDDRRDKAAATIGLDYMLQSNRVRPTIGAAYAGKHSYLGVDMGFDLNGGGIDFGMGAGAVKTEN